MEREGGRAADDKLGAAAMRIGGAHQHDLHPKMGRGQVFV